LHDLHGNAAEWCRDGGYYDRPARSGDGERETALDTPSILRGGDYGSQAARARSSYRAFASPGTTDRSQGFRAARPVLR
jgi:formylglycine-generating enzyme required for sulfatase activity